MSTLVDEIRRAAALVMALPEPIAYFVIDPTQPAGGFDERRDADGRRCVFISPALLDGYRMVRDPAELWPPGIPVFAHENRPR